MYTEEFDLAILNLIMLVLHIVVPANDDTYNINLKKVIEDIYDDAL